MNLHITYNTNHIDNFLNVDIASEKFDEHLRQISQASCSNVIISEAINGLTYEKSKEVLNETISKLRINGTISIVAVDFDAIATNFINGNMDYKYLGNILSSINSIIPNHELVQTVKNHNITIITVEKRDFLIIIHGRRDNA